MDIKIGFVFLIIAVISCYVETVDVPDGVENKQDHRTRVGEQIKKIKDSDRSKTEKAHRIAAIRKHLENEYKRNNKEIESIKEVYKSQKETASKMKKVKIDGMTDDQKMASLGKLRGEFDHNVEEMRSVLSGEQKEKHELKSLLKQLMTGKKSGGGH